MIGKVKKAINEGGIALLIQRTFNYVHLAVRDFLPSSYRLLNGIKVPGKTLDKYNTSLNSSDYEEPLIEGLKNSVNKGDKVVIVGSGHGVSAVYAAREAGKGHVQIYEPAEERINETLQTLDMNNGSGYEITQAAFYMDEESWGDSSGAEILQAEDLPKCDVLELDCEGAEKPILQNLEIEPRAIIVETHGVFDSSKEELKQILNKKGYTIESETPENEDKGIHILYAKR